VDDVVTGRPEAPAQQAGWTRSNSRGPSLTLLLPNYGHYLAHLDHRQFVDLARMADDAGVDRIALTDHVVMGSHTDAYPWGEFPLAADGPWYEPLTLLSAMAAVTSDVRLATLILIAPLRNPVVLAKTAATLDQLSGGRLDLGVGVGWQREEYDAAGLAWGDRWRLLSETLSCCKALWGAQPASYSGSFTSFTDIYCVPTPKQPDGVPFWLGGGSSSANSRRLARWCDGWIPVPINGATVADIVTVLRDGLPKVQSAWQERDRDPSRLQVTVALPLVKNPETRRSDLRLSLEGAPDLLAAGATDISIPLQAFCREFDRVPYFLADLVVQFRKLTSPDRVQDVR
jgi:probable F420-dependent oxidoreductase